MAEYEVSYTAFKHVHVEADSEEEALEKADPHSSMSHERWEVTEERVNGPY